MIQQLKIFNFQSHKSSELNFAPGVNVIIGKSDCGKTAIVRTIKKVVWNKPGGEAFRSNWGGDMEIELTTDERRIGRGIGKENWYRIDDEKRLVAFGTGVPESIQTILNMDDTNLQQQLDVPFLISNTPGEVSAYFNKIAHLEQIDTGLKNLQQEIRTCTNKKKSDEDRIVELQTDLADYEYLSKFEIDLEVLEQDQIVLTNLRNAKQHLESVLTEIETTTADIDEISTLPQYEKQVDALLKLHETMRIDLSDLKGLLALTSTIHNLHSDMLILERKTALESDVGDVLLLHNKKKEIAWDYETLESSLTLIERTQQDIKTIKESIISKEELFYENMPSTCPLCGTNLTR